VRAYCIIAFEDYKDMGGNAKEEKERKESIDEGI